MEETTQPAAVRLTQARTPEPETVRASASAVSTTAFPISEEAKRAEARLLRSAMAARKTA